MLKYSLIFVTIYIIYILHLSPEIQMTIRVKNCQMVSAISNGFMHAIYSHQSIDNKFACKAMWDYNIYIWISN